jgi:hypothetical protein
MIYTLIAISRIYRGLYQRLLLSSAYATSDLAGGTLTQLLALRGRVIRTSRY